MGRTGRDEPWDDGLETDEGLATDEGDGVHEGQGPRAPSRVLSDLDTPCSADCDPLHTP